MVFERDDAYKHTFNNAVYLETDFFKTKDELNKFIDNLI